MKARTLIHRARRAWNALLGRPLAKSSIYKGAETSRLTNDWVATAATPDDELRWSLMRLRARARELARNNPYVRAYLKLVAINVIGANGMALQAQVKDNSGNPNKRINDAIEAGWADWSQDVTVGAPLSLAHFEQQLLRTIATEGEIFVRLWRGFGNRYAFAFEAIDPDLVDETMNRVRGSRGENEIRMGVEVNQFGRPVAYWVWDRPLSIISPPSERKRLRIPADEILHLYDPERVNHSRGVSWLAPVMFTLKQLDGMEEAVLILVRVAASKMGFFTRKEGEVGSPPAGDENGVIEMEANPGSFEFAPAGYELETFDPSLPNSEYVPFVKSMIRKIASGLGISYNVLANDLESVNYSSMRSGLAGERDTWRTLQQWWIGAFRRRIYREWLAMAWLVGGVQLDSRDFRKFLEVNWVPRGWAGVDPQKDNEADILAIDRGLLAPQDVVAEQGRDLEETYRKIADANKLAKELGIDVGPKDLAAKPASKSRPEAGAGGEEEEGTEQRASKAQPLNRLTAALRNGHQRRNGVHQRAA